ncbi:MAG: hypothetical protein AAGF67_03330 [Verrucomicrobiota bacterium]
MRWSLCLVATFFLGSVHAGDWGTVVLQPEVEKLEEVEVPLLHREVPEHELSGGGLTMEPEAGPYQWLSDDGRIRLRVGVGEDKFEEAVLTIWNWDNIPIYQKRIRGGTEGQFPVEIEGFGSYLVTLDGMSEGEVQRRMIRNITVTPDMNAARETWKLDEFFLGICTFPGRYHWTPGGEATLPKGLTEEEARNLEADLMARLGFQVVRTDESLEMGRRESDENEFLFNFDRMDAAVEAYTSRGFEIGLQLMNAADWAVAEKHNHVEEHRWRYPHEEKAQRAYIKALLERYGESARFVQIFNEPDQVEFWSGTPDEFVTQFEFSKEQIREDFPEVPIANGGYAFVDDEKTAFFIERLHPHVDYSAYHAHGTLEGMIENFEKMKAQHNAVGVSPAKWVNTETGFDAWRLDQERRQAQAVAQKVLYCWAHDHAGIMLFCGRMTRGPGRDGRDLGLVDYQFCSRFAYGAVAGLVSVLQGASFESVLVEEEGVFAYEFVVGEERVVSAFSLSDEGALSFESDASQVMVCDPMGNVVRQVAGGDVDLSLDGYPQYLVFRNAGSVALSE